VFLLLFFGLPSSARRLKDDCLVAVREATHARHDAEHVVVERVDADLRRARARDRVERDRELQRGLVNAREVARAAGLVLLGAQRERVHADTRGRRAAVVLVRLDLVKVRSLTLREAVLAVELKLGNLNRVLALAAHVGRKDDLREQVVNTRLKLLDAVDVRGIRTDERRRLRDTLAQRGGQALRGRRAERATSRRLGQQRRDQAIRAEVIGVVERLGTANRREPRGRGAVNERIALDDPLELLDGVVEVQLDLVGR